MSGVSPQQENLLMLCALHHNSATVDWHLIARTCQSEAGLETLLAGEIPEDSTAARPCLTFGGDRK